MALHLMGGGLEFFEPAVFVPRPVLEIEDKGHEVHEAPEADVLQNEFAIVPRAVVWVPKGQHVEVTVVLEEVHRRHAVRPLVG